MRGQIVPTTESSAVAQERNLQLGVIGNCAVSALVDPRGTIVWSCVPRFDCDPVFYALLGGERPSDGLFAIDLKGCVRSEQFYEPRFAGRRRPARLLQGLAAAGQGVSPSARALPGDA
jgi:hypothetical protein